jgi:hypothetical protein
MKFLMWDGWDYGVVLACAVGLFACALFIIRYGVEAGRSMWDNPFGRYLMTRKLVLMALFGYILFNRWVGGIELEDKYPAQDLAAFVIFGAFALQTFVPYRLLMNAQHAHDKEARRND